MVPVCYYTRVRYGYGLTMSFPSIEAILPVYWRGPLYLECSGGRGCFQIQPRQQVITDCLIQNSTGETRLCNLNADFRNEERGYADVGRGHKEHTDLWSLVFIYFNNHIWLVKKIKQDSDRWQKNDKLFFLLLQSRFRVVCKTKSHCDGQPLLKIHQ